MECENRLVQRGPTFRLEVFRCGGGVQKYVKGVGRPLARLHPAGLLRLRVRRALRPPCPAAAPPRRPPSRAAPTADPAAASDPTLRYIGEYISDDEAESRGIRYDDKMMSRLMDVYGDGKDVVRMCIDATNFSNLGRFLNHCCDPNCFKQRVFCDHDSRLPRIAFFALRDIEPNVELVYDYGYADVPGKTMLPLRREELQEASSGAASGARSRALCGGPARDRGELFNVRRLPISWTPASSS